MRLYLDNTIFAKKMLKQKESGSEIVQCGVYVGPLRRSGSYSVVRSLMLLLLLLLLWRLSGGE